MIIRLAILLLLILAVTAGCSGGGGTQTPVSPTASASATPTDTVSATPTPSPTGALTYPAQWLNLTNWKITLPFDGSDSNTTADEINQPALATYKHDTYFHLNPSQNGVIFQAHCGGATTSGSGYPRSELREMTNNGASNASWSSTSGTHRMFIRQAITHLPVAKPHVVAGQIHGTSNVSADSDDITVFRLEGTQLYITDGDTSHAFLLDANYQLGTIFTCEFVVSNGKIEYYYNGQKVGYSQSKSDIGWYFKAGCYTQSNTSRGDLPTAYGEVIIYELTITHI